MKVTPHFDTAEFACHDGTPYPDEWVAERLTPLCEALEVIRAAAGSPVTIVSGYRSQAYNDARRRNSSGVAKDSQHIHGRAADVRCAGLPSEELHGVVMRLYRAGKLPQVGGVGRYRGWVHIDVREKVGGRLAQWTGEGVDDSAA